MEYRQYQNLTETYLSQVNEDTKQEELNESLPLILRGLRAAYTAAKANRAARTAARVGTEVLAPGTITATKGSKLRRIGAPLAAGFGYSAADITYDDFFGPTDAEGNPLYGQPGDDYDGDGQLNVDDLDDDNDGIPDTEDDTANPPRGPFNVIGAGDFIFDLPDAASKLISRLLYSSNPDDYLPDDDDGMNP